MTRPLDYGMHEGKLQDGLTSRHLYATMFHGTSLFLTASIFVIRSPNDCCLVRDRYQRARSGAKRRVPHRGQKTRCSRKHSNNGCAKCSPGGPGNSQPRPATPRLLFLPGRKKCRGYHCASPTMVSLPNQGARRDALLPSSGLALLCNLLPPQYRANPLNHAPPYCHHE